AIGADGTIYFGSYDDNLYTLNPGGTLKWKFPTANGVDASPAIGADGTIYVGTIDTSDLLYAVTDGGQGVVSQKWAFKAGDDVESSAAIGSDGTIYVGSDDDNLYALNPDGTVKWTFATGAYVYSSPAIGADGTIYVGSEDNNLYAVGIPSPTPTPTATIAPTATPTATPTPVPVTLEIKPKALRFPKTAVGTSSKPKKVKVSNPKGARKRPGIPVLVEQISDPGIFTQSNNCPATLAAGTDCTISVTFTPSAATKQRATMTITDNAKGTPQTVQLSGVGH
ncbi:PQQ-binding-like beta-propeller repeat protein, partial [Candidatus Binatus sp.]|uniref:choice-of-anchor D domain-containing protein n=1 Tax=Candidatus Binatus sp. TaxID=2811406 RepID=UPI003C8A5BA5